MIFTKRVSKVFSSQVKAAEFFAILLEAYGAKNVSFRPVPQGYEVAIITCKMT